MQNPKVRLVVVFALAIAGSTTLIGCGGPTGGDECDNNADCDNAALRCVTNYEGTSSGTCVENDDQPLICQTPCENDADCKDAEFGHKAAPRCFSDCQGSKYCTWDVAF